MKPWKCLTCGRMHEYMPDLRRDVHCPTRESARAMGYTIKVADKPPAIDPTIVETFRQMAEACKTRAAKCDGLGLSDLAGCLTRCQADLESTLFLRMKYDGMALPVESDLTTNLFTGAAEPVHTKEKPKRASKRTEL